MRLVILRNKPKRVLATVSKSKGQEIGVYGENFDGKVKKKKTDRSSLLRVRVTEPVNEKHNLDVAWV